MPAKKRFEPGLIAAMLSQGLNTKAIADKLGCSKGYADHVRFFLGAAAIGLSTLKMPISAYQGRVAYYSQPEPEPEEM